MYNYTIPRYKLTAGLLGIFLGMFGAHNFYLGNRSRAQVQLIVTFAGSLVFGLGPIVSFFWGVIEGIMILTGTIAVDGVGNPILNPTPPQANSKSKIIAGFLGILLGTFGVHNFYLGNIGKAVGQLLLGTVGSCLIVGPIISAVWGIIDGVQILSGNISQDGTGEPIWDPASDGVKHKSKTAATILAFTFGYLGIHNFYLGNTNKGLAQLLMSTVGACLILPAIAAYVWALVDGVQIVSGDISTEANGGILLPD